MIAWLTRHVSFQPIGAIYKHELRIVITTAPASWTEYAFSRMPSMRGITTLARSVSEVSS